MTLIEPYATAARSGMSAGACGSVAWERSAGLFVYLVLGLAVLVLLPSGLPMWLPLVVAGVIVGALAGALLLSGRPPRGASRAARAFRAAATRHPRRPVGPAGRAGHRAGVGRRRRRPCGHAALGGAYRRSERTPRPVAAAGRARAARDGGADEHRRLGPSGGRGRVGVRRRRSRRRPGRGHDHRVRRPFARRHLARHLPCSSPPGYGVAAAQRIHSGMGRQRSGRTWCRPTLGRSRLWLSVPTPC